MHLRPATNQDREQIRELIYAVLKEHGLEPDPAGTDADLADIEETYRNGHFEVLEENGKIVGTWALIPTDIRSGEMRKAYLLPEFRRKGYGKLLLERAITEAKKRGFHRLTLETSSKLRRAIEVIESQGFQPIAGKPHTPRCDRAYELYL
ncbi:MAG: GNAT family N-acetyltransferase [Bdellovibrionota bacterium]